MTFDEIELHRKNMVNAEGKFTLVNRDKLLKMINIFIEEYSLIILGNLSKYTRRIELSFIIKIPFRVIAR